VVQHHRFGFGIHSDGFVGTLDFYQIFARIGMTVDGYINALPAAQRNALLRLRALIKSHVPLAEETISYGMPAFKQNGILLYYAAFTNHMSLFVMPKVLDQVRPLLDGRSTTKSAIHFTEINPIPDIIIAQCVALRLAEIDAKLVAKKAKKSNTK
jgi:uncharacterized protein YdhG (YjbR/CyaY superfamily)